MISREVYLNREADTLSGVVARSACGPDDAPGAAYNIRLANGDVWRLSASHESALWTAQLARLLGLELDHELPVGPGEIVTQTIEKRAGPAVSDGSCPMAVFSDTEGWLVQEFGQVRTRRHAHAPSAAAEVSFAETGPYENSKRVFSLFPLYEHVCRAGGFPIHAAFVEWRGRSCLLAGRSGAGKTTSCRRLSDAWRALSDDEALIIAGPSHRYFGHPLPTWSRVITGTERPSWCSVNESRPIDMLFLLEQHQEDEVVPVGNGEALFFLINLAMDKWRRFTMPRSEDRRAASRLMFHNVSRFLEHVPVRRLRVSLHGRFWLHMEQALLDGEASP